MVHQGDIDFVEGARFTCRTWATDVILDNETQHDHFPILDELLLPISYIDT